VGGAGGHAALAVFCYVRTVFGN